jgi:hypothetical protein
MPSRPLDALVGPVEAAIDQLDSISLAVKRGETPSMAEQQALFGIGLHRQGRHNYQCWLEESTDRYAKTSDPSYLHPEIHFAATSSLAAWPERDRDSLFRSGLGTLSKEASCEIHRVHHQEAGAMLLASSMLPRSAEYLRKQMGDGMDDPPYDDCLRLNSANPLAAAHDLISNESWSLTNSRIRDSNRTHILYSMEAWPYLRQSEMQEVALLLEGKPLPRFSVDSSSDDTWYRRGHRFDLVQGIQRLREVTSGPRPVAGPPELAFSTPDWVYPLVTRGPEPWNTI